MGVGLIVGVWIARYLGPEQFGLLSFAAAFIGLFGAIATLGLQGVVVRDIVLNPEGKEVTLGTTAVMQFFGGFIAYGLILVIIFWLRADDAMAKTVVTILGVIMLFKSSEVAVYWFESQVLSKYIVWVQNTVFLVFAIIKVCLIQKNAPLITFAWAMMGESLVVALLMVLLLSLQGSKIGKISISYKRAKTLLADSWPLMLSGMAVMAYMKIDQIMLGQIIGNEAVGIYSAAVRISEVWYFFPVAIISSVFPSILNAKKTSEVEYFYRLESLYKLMVLIALAVALPLTFFSTSIIDVIFGINYAKAGQVLSIHIWSAVFLYLNVASSKWFLIEGLQFLTLLRQLAGVMSNVFFNLFLIPYYGIEGAAWGTFFSHVISGFIFDAFQKKTRVTFFMKTRAILNFWNLRHKF